MITVLVWVHEIDDVGYMLTVHISFFLLSKVAVKISYCHKYVDVQ